MPTLLPLKRGSFPENSLSPGAPSSEAALTKKNKQAAVAITVLVMAAAALLFVFREQTGHRLVLFNDRTGEIITSYPFGPKDTFAIRFIHSVNQSPVTDRYEIRDGYITVVETTYYHFGAGVQTELNEGEHLSYAEDGAMIISGINKRTDPLRYIVGTVSDHILLLHGQEISLRDLCGRNTLVRFSYQ